MKIRQQTDKEREREREAEWHCVCELVLNLTLRKERGRGVIRVSNVSLIKVDKAEGEKGRGENTEFKRSKGDEAKERGHFFSVFLIFIFCFYPLLVLS